MKKILVDSIINRMVLLAVAALGLTACEKTVVLDLKQTEPKVVVDALLTTDSTRHYVRLTRTVDFYNRNTPPAITDARVTVTDGQTTWEYRHQADRPGRYLPDQPFAGRVGRFYRLRIETGGQVIEGGDELVRVADIDSIRFELDTDRLNNPNDDETDEQKARVFSLLFYAREPQQTRDFYLLKQYRNGKRIDNNGTQVLVSDDELIGEAIEGVELLDHYAPGDTAVVEMFSISRTAFVFYSDLTNVLINDGGMFSPIPADPRSNLTGGALGLFQVSDVRRRTAVAPQLP
jgi:hypothetical protein